MDRIKLAQTYYRRDRDFPRRQRELPHPHQGGGTGLGTLFTALMGAGLALGGVGAYKLLSGAASGGNKAFKSFMHSPSLSKPKPGQKLLTNLEDHTFTISPENYKISMLLQTLP